MKIALYVIIFIMGSFFGSFCAYAINRIPKKNSITETKSTCEFCKHKFGALDNIPIMSYIFCGGKCRYCGKKRNSGYFWTELLMGLVAVGIYYSIHGMWGTMSILTLTEFLYLMIFITTITIIAVIDKKNKKIYKPIIFVGLAFGLMHILYLYFTNNAGLSSIHRYLLFGAIICVLSMITSKYKYYKFRYLLEIMMICIYINMFVVYEVFLITAVLTMILLVVNVLIKKRMTKVDNSDILVDNEVQLDLPIAYLLCISNIIALIVQGIVIM